LVGQSKEFHHLLGGLGIGVAVLDKAVSPNLARQAHQELEVMADEGKLSEFSRSFLDKIGSNFFLFLLFVCVGLMNDILQPEICHGVFLIFGERVSHLGISVPG